MIYPFRNKFDKLFSDLKESSIEIIQNNCENGFYGVRKTDDYVDIVYYRHQTEKNFIYSENYKEITTLIPSEMMVEWVDETTKHELQGVINLFNFFEALFIGSYQDVLDGKKSGTGKLLFTDEPTPFINYGAKSWGKVPEENKPYWDKGRYFHADSQAGLFTVIIQEVNHEKKHLEFDFDDLYLLYEDGTNFHTYSLVLKLDEYMDMLLLTKGCTYWQLLFIEKPSENLGQYEIKYILKMLLGLPELFSEENYSPLFMQFEKELVQATANSIKNSDVEKIAPLLEEYYKVRKRYL